MKLDNPWIVRACSEHAVARNTLDTFLQEQYGQLGEDLILEGILKSHFARHGRPPSSIRYLEVGANHPIQTSNTYLFHQKWGGSGVLVEANPRLIGALEKVRSRDRVVHRAVVPAGFPAEVELAIAANSELSSVDAGHIASFGAIGRVDGTARVPTVTLDELLQSEFADGLDLLSIDIEGLDLQVLRGARLPVRPSFVVTEPSRHYQRDAERQFAEVMQAKGYVEVARTDYNLIYADQAALQQAPRAAPVRLRVASFDVFDTLIARRCVTASAVFDELERRAGIPGLAKARQQAERAVESRDYTILDIYARLGADLGLSEEAANALMAQELEIELDNVVPVANNVARLDPESVLITDMYLSADLIRLFLERAGVPAELPIVQTSHGKRSGRIWSALSDAGFECAHLGDNTHSDFRTCLHAGMKPELQAEAEPTRAERHLQANGFPRFAQCLRAVRLTSYSADLQPWQRRTFFELNLPMLLAFVSVIRQFACGVGLKRLLFSSRDCHHLKQVFDATGRALGGDAAQSLYWHTSRITRTSGSAAYLDYCRSLFGKDSAVVDLCGTGASMVKLLADLGPEVPRPAIVLCERIDNPAQLQEYLQAYGVGANEPLHILDIVSSKSFVDNEYLEMMNYVPQGMVVRVEPMAGNFLPVRDTLEFDPARKALVEQGHRLVVEACARLPQFFDATVQQELDAQGPQLVSMLHDLAAMLRAELGELRAAFQASHRSYELVTRHRLGARGPQG
jgi:FkbM family methyltransferase